MALMPTRENGPAARSFAADAHDSIMVRIKLSYRIQVCGTKMRPHGELPSDPQQAAVLPGTEEVANLNRGLEARVNEQVEELGRVGRLKRFLAPQLAELIVSQGDEKILESHRCNG